jgi:hypothetical protein
MKKLNILGVIFLGILCVQTGFSQDAKSEKVTSFSGKVFRSDTKAAVPDVVIFLLDEKKSEKQNNSVETRTDKKGNFLIENVKPGKYTIIIEATFDREEDVPCQLLMGKIDEPNSSLIVETKEGKKIEHIYIKGFNFKAGKEIKKEFDLVCKSMFGG